MSNKPDTMLANAQAQKIRELEAELERIKQQLQEILEVIHSQKI